MRRMSFKVLTKTTIAVVAILSFIEASQALASSRHHSSRSYNHRHAEAAVPHVLQCVIFARAASDVALHGNAVNWWHNAQGLYARGTVPEVGSVLNFRAITRMRLGHVAVVTQIVDRRTIQIDQSHWNANGISRDVSVIDVSPDNDWSAVRVAIAHRDTFGSIYPTYGFIYARPDRSGRIVTARSDAISRGVGMASSDLHSVDAEVAEAPAAAGIGTTASLVTDDAPNRSLQ